MSMTDPIADLLTRIRNASMAGHKRLTVPSTNLKREVVRVMQENNFIRGFAEQAGGVQSTLHIRLRYTPSQEPIIRGIQRVSRPGLRRYANCEEVRQYNRRMGIVVVSTSRGIMSGDEAIAVGIGGEILCHVW